MNDLSPEQFTHLVLIAAAPPHRVGQGVARLIGEEITIGPLHVGPGGMATATATGVRGQVHVAIAEDAEWRQIVIVPISLSVDVRIGGRTVRYYGAVQVQTRVRLRLEQPCTVAVDVEDIEARNIRTVITPVGFAARVVGRIGNVTETVAEHVLSYVRELVESQDFVAAMHIDVIGLMRRAWDADLVVQLPPR